uniref:Bestrophin homolog n=1 Tax=Panagrolaimus davidi TaxID=227884 RepID=A0A914RDC3_9BILA
MEENIKYQSKQDFGEWRGIPQFFGFPGELTTLLLNHVSSVFLKPKINKILFLSTAVAVATYISGDDDNTRAVRRTIIRYLVLCQTFVLRNISVQVRRRFPTLEAIEAANLMTSEERLIIEETTDEYTQFWIPSIWAEKLLCEARKNGKISSDPIAANISSRIDEFRIHLKNMILFDWIPIPLVYPQLVTFCVRLYFLVCLFTRQIVKSKEAALPVRIFMRGL